MKKNLILLLILIILLLQTGCLYAVRYDGPYRGKVVDQVTREPLEGVVVLGTWSVYHFGLGGGYSTYYDARETVTGKNGEFVIQGEGLRILSSIKPMSFVIFKAGHTYFESHWDALKPEVYAKDELQWEGEMPVFQLKKLTTEEKKKAYGPHDPPREATFEKVKLMLMEIDKNDRERGLKPRGTWQGHKIE